MATVRARAEYVAHRDGYWCLSCGLLSGRRVWYTVSPPQQPMTMGVAVVCRVCGGDDVVHGDND